MVNGSARMPTGAPRDLLIHNARRVDARGERDQAWLLVRQGRILAAGTGDSWRHDPQTAQAEQLDARGRRLTPGFIDLHFHGGGGFSNEDGPEALRGALQAHRQRGTTRAVASLVTNPVPVLVPALEQIAALSAQDPLLLGSHLEGPFLSEGKKGAHSARHLTDPDPAALRDLLAAAAGTLRQVTLDPQRPGSDAAIETLCAAGVVVAVGHTEAGYDQALRAFRNGASVLTHSFNGMAGLHHRDPGPVLAAADAEGTVLELILDGRHVHPRVAALLFDLAPHRVALVTDAMAAAAGPPGRYRLGEVEVEVSDGAALVAGSTSLAGSTATMDELLRQGLAAGLDAVTVVEALTLTPATALGLQDRLGLLEPGYAADFVLLTENWTVDAVFADGALLAGTP